VLISLILPVFAHGTSWNTSRMSAWPGSDEAWAIVDGWGLIHTTNAQDWQWVCEESLGVVSSSDVLAIAPGQAIVGTSGGLKWVQDGCQSQGIPGIPEDVQITRVIQADNTHFWAAGSSTTQGGLWWCSTEGCTETEFMGTGDQRLFIRSLWQSGSRTYISVIEEQGLGCSLWVADNGQWQAAATWPAGDLDVRVLYAKDDQVLAWAQSRSDATIPALLISQDAGKTFVKGFELGNYRDPIPDLVVIQNRTFLSSYLGRTWCSEDQGQNFRDVSETAPLLRCAAQDGDRSWLCTDHFADGYDIAITTNGRQFTPVGCLDQVELATCTQESCGALYFDFVSYGGTIPGICSQESSDTGTTPSEHGCGKGSALLWLLPLSWGARGRRRG